MTHFGQAAPPDPASFTQGTIGSHPVLANHTAMRAFDKALSVQRPVVLAHIRSIRLRHPEAGPAEVIRVLERRYLAALTSGGAAVGITAAVPAVGTATALALSTVETVGFLETTALFAQSVAEVHDLPIADPDRARLLVMTLLLGEEGTDLLDQLAAQAAGKGEGKSSFWGEMVTKTLPVGLVGPVFDRVRATFMRKLMKKGGASLVGKAIPFGVGAVIGGTGNHILGKRVVKSSRQAFGTAPLAFPLDLAPKGGAEPIEVQFLRGIRSAGGTIGSGLGAAARGAKRLMTPPRRSK